jgi:hypothetical protein
MLQINLSSANLRHLAQYATYEFSSHLQVFGVPPLLFGVLEQNHVKHPRDTLKICNVAPKSL